MPDTYVSFYTKNKLVLQWTFKECYAALKALQQCQSKKMPVKKRDLVDLCEEQKDRASRSASSNASTAVGYAGRRVSELEGAMLGNGSVTNDRGRK